MIYTNEEVLEAFGFENKGDHWRFDQDIKDADSGTSAHIAVTVKFAKDGSLIGKIPMVNRHDALDMANFDGPGLYYQSADVADMVALAQSEVGCQTLDVTGHPSDEGFANEDADMWVTSPFMGGDYFDYDVSERTAVDDGYKMILENPQKNYQEYDTWKAKFIEKLMQPTSPTP